MDRVMVQKRKRKAILNGIRTGGFGIALLLVFAIVGGLEAGTITLGMGVWLLLLCFSVLLLCRVSVE